MHDISIAKNTHTFIHTQNKINVRSSRHTSLAHIIMAYHQALPLNGRSLEKSYKHILLPLNYFMHKKQKYYYSLFLAELGKHPDVLTKVAENHSI
jgi:hypothetical protein